MTSYFNRGKSVFFQFRYRKSVLRSQRKQRMFKTAKKAMPGINYIDTDDAVEYAEVKHGRWVVDEADAGEADGYPAYIEFHCPICNEQYSLESRQYDWFYGDDIPFNFCHECGTKMDGECREG